MRCFYFSNENEWFRVETSVCDAFRKHCRVEFGSQKNHYNRGNISYGWLVFAIIPDFFLYYLRKEY